MYSAQFFEDEEEEAPKKEKKRRKKNERTGITCGESRDGRDRYIFDCAGSRTFYVASGVDCIAVRCCDKSHVLIGLIEGVIRLAIFLGYVIAISRMEDIKRTYMYHGAEHKTINCLEHGNELTVENVMQASRFHKRCGTSFLFIVMIVSILVFMCITVDAMWLRLLLRVLLVPVIAGISYEFIRFAGNSESWIANLLSKPGLLIQRLTTKEPTEDMVEVAIASVEAVLDWRAYLEEQAKSEK